MKQKIEWYREVLDLEPSSKVFFPLAKLLAADGQTHDAIAVLRQGALRHPEHIEARLFLIELLITHGLETDLATEVENLGSLFAGYPNFWEAWGNKLAENAAMRDAALAMRFFAAALQGQQLTWATIIEHGLQAMLTSPVQHPKQSTPHVASQSTSLSSSIAPLSDREPLQEKEAVFLEEKEGEPHKSYEDEGEDEDEDFSLRTRTMAEVLADQGDIEGAIDIYHELMANAPEAEKATLEARAAELSKRLTASVTHPDSTETGKDDPADKDSSRLTGLLESLAERLEARSR